MQQSEGSEGKGSSTEVERAQEKFILSQTNESGVRVSPDIRFSTIPLGTSFREDLNFLECKVENNKEPVPGDEPDEANQEFNKEIVGERVNLEKIERENQKSIFLTVNNFLQPKFIVPGDDE